MVLCPQLREQVHELFLQIISSSNNSSQLWGYCNLRDVLACCSALSPDVQRYPFPCAGLILPPLLPLSLLHDTWTLVTSKDLLFNVLECHIHREEERSRERSSVNDLLRKWLQGIELCQVHLQGLPHGCRIPWCWAILSCFPRP